MFFEICAVKYFQKEIFISEVSMVYWKKDKCTQLNFSIFWNELLKIYLIDSNVPIFERK